MTFWQGQFKGCVDGVPRDTFLDMSDWRKGVAFVNGFNLGRYWPAVGPQMTMYVPAPILQQNCSQSNTITLFEQEKPPCLSRSRGGNLVTCQVQFVQKPRLDGPVPIA